MDYLFAVYYFAWIHLVLSVGTGIIMTVLLVASFYYSVRTEKTIMNETEKYISTLSHRIKKVGEEALLEMPIGIVLFSEDYNVEWTNPYMNQLGEENKLVGK